MMHGSLALAASTSRTLPQHRRARDELHAFDGRSSAERLAGVRWAWHRGLAMVIGSVEGASFQGALR